MKTKTVKKQTKTLETPKTAKLPVTVDAYIQLVINQMTCEEKTKEFCRNYFKQCEAKDPESTLAGIAREFRIMGLGHLFDI